VSERSLVEARFLVFVDLDTFDPARWELARGYECFRQGRNGSLSPLSTHSWHVLVCLCNRTSASGTIDIARGTDVDMSSLTRARWNDKSLRVIPCSCFDSRECRVTPMLGGHSFALGVDVASPGVIEKESREPEPSC